VPDEHSPFHNCVSNPEFFHFKNLPKIYLSKNSIDLPGYERVVAHEIEKEPVREIHAELWRQ
jgi:hypothetical protein